MRKLILSLLALTFIILGFCGWFRGFAIAMTKTALIRDELPLGDLTGVTVDGNGNVYCGLGFYQRIQVYDSRGRFKYGRGIDAAGGDFLFHIDEDDRLVVATVRNDKVFYFENGALVNEETSDSRYFEFYNRYSRDECFDSEKNYYRIAPWSLIWPQVIRAEMGNGHRSVIVSTPFWKWLLMGPFPAWLFVAGGMGLFYLVHRGFFKSIFGRG